MQYAFCRIGYLACLYIGKVRWFVNSIYLHDYYYIIQHVGFCCLFIPRHYIVAGYYGFTLDVHVSVHLSVHPSVCRTSVRFSFPDDNLGKHWWIFTKFGMCIDMVEIWFGIVNGQISTNLDGVICPRQPIFSFLEDNLSKSQGILTKLGTCIDMKGVWFGIANGQMSSMFDRVIFFWRNINTVQTESQCTVSRNFSMLWIETIVGLGF